MQKTGTAAHKATDIVPHLCALYAGHEVPDLSREEGTSGDLVRVQYADVRDLVGLACGAADDLVSWVRRHRSTRQREYLRNMHARDITVPFCMLPSRTRMRQTTPLYLTRSRRM